MSIFKKVIRREVPSEILYEDELCLAFKDTNPQAPVHFLMIPKKEIKSLADVQREDQALLGHLMLKIAEVAKDLGLDEEGYRVALNTGRDAGQTVPHLHFHVLGGRSLEWPPG
jgi:histidine triad (HIT) family protein